MTIDLQKLTPGARLRVLLALRGEKYTPMVFALKLNAGAVSRFANELQKTLPEREMRQIAEYLGVSEETIFGPVSE